jgi:hypothetical protein
MKKIICKYSGDCAKTGKRIIRGEWCYYDPQTRRIYSLDSVDEERREADNVRAYVQAQEDAYFERIERNYGY